MFNIDGFRSNIHKQGTLRTNRFRVIIPVPNSLRDSAVSSGVGDMGNLLTFRAEQIKAPGITINSDQVYRYGIGTTQQMPYSAAYTDNVISFISDGRGLIWNFWYLWINSIFGFSGNDNNFNGGAFNTLPSYQLAYKEDYATQISVIVYDQLENEIQKINMYDAFPISINDNQLGWGDNNRLLKVTVGFTFKEFSIEGAGSTVLSAAPTSPVKIAPTSSATTPMTPIQQ